jgi:hypothetical protein
MSSKIYTVAQLAELLQFKTTRPIYDEIHAGRLRARLLPSGDFRIDAVDVETWWDAMIFEPLTTRTSVRPDSRAHGQRHVARPQRKPFQSKPGPSLAGRSRP